MRLPTTPRTAFVSLGISGALMVSGVVPTLAQEEAEAGGNSVAASWDFVADAQG